MPRGGIRTGQRVGRSKADTTNALEICGHKIYRLDPYNFALHKNGETEPKYFPTVHSALLYLFQKKLGDGDMGLQNLLNRIELSERNIVNAINGGCAGEIAGVVGSER